VALTGRNISLDKKILNAIDYELGKRHDQRWNPDLLVIFQGENVLMSINSVQDGDTDGDWRMESWEDSYVSTSVEGTLYWPNDAKKRASLGGEALATNWKSETKESLINEFVAKY
jgi:hypothetical protein